MEEKEDRNKRIGITTSVVFHLILLLLFAFFGLSYMEPPPEEEGITINFGYTDAGRQSENENTPAEQSEVVPEEVNTEQPTPQETVNEEILTQEDSEAPSIDKEEKKEQEQVVEKEEPKPDKNLSDALNRWKTNKSKPGGGDGTTDQAGDQGDINGDPNSNNYEGGGFGNGNTFSLAGRKLLSSPKIEDNSQEEGKVVVDIIVDRYGKVLRATPGARNSTTTSSVLYQKAKKAALQTKFNANPDAAEEQKGQMTFIFILN